MAAGKGLIGPLKLYAAHRTHNSRAPAVLSSFRSSSITDVSVMPKPGIHHPTVVLHCQLPFKTPCGDCSNRRPATNNLPGPTGVINSLIVLN